MLAIKTILHPTDFSERAEFAFRLAGSLARDYGARLIVLHVAELPMAVSGVGVLMIPPPIDEKPLRDKLEEFRAHNPKVPVEHRMVEGDPASEILRVAGETRCDVIIMGTHGRTGLGRLLMGSVAEQVVRRAACPVLTVKDPHEIAWATGEPLAEAAGKAMGAV